MQEVFREPLRIEDYEELNYGGFKGRFKVVVPPGYKLLECHEFRKNGEPRIGFTEDTDHRRLVEFETYEMYKLAETQVLRALMRIPHRNARRRAKRRSARLTTRHQ